MPNTYERLLEKVEEYREQIEKLERRGASELELSIPRANYNNHKVAADRRAEQLYAFKHTLPPVYLNGTKPERNGKYGSIYLIYNGTERSGYVGMTDYEVEDRLLDHAFGFSGGKSIGNAFERLPKESFYFYVLEQCADFDGLGERECYWIAFLGTYRHGYNGNTGGRRGFQSRLARAERNYENFRRSADTKLAQLRSLPRNAPPYRGEAILREYRSCTEAANRLEAEINLWKAQKEQSERGQE